jgi:hypothetical protein
MMGDIVACPAKSVRFRGSVAASAGILSVELRRGSEVIETIRPHRELPMARRFRIEWSGAEYRGRARQTIWDGSLTIMGAHIVSARPINFLNPDRPLKQVSESKISWSSITTGNYAGVDLVVSGDEGTIEIVTALGELTVDLSDVTHEPIVKAYGKLARELRISRQPDTHTVESIEFERSVNLADGDNPLWICASFADGHQAWSSPIYVISSR